MKVFFCGIVMAQYAHKNLTNETKVTVKVFLRVFASICEIFIFLYLGLGLSAFGEDKTTFSIPMIGIAFASILISRTHVFLICGIHNLFQKKKPIPLKQMTLIWFSGLRGAVAFALGVTFGDIDGFSADAKSLIFGTTLVVVFLTVRIFIYYEKLMFISFYSIFPLLLFFNLLFFYFLFLYFG